MIEQDRVRLVVSREEAKLRIRARLVAGGELVRSGIASEKELGHAEDDLKIWTDVTAEELRQIATSDELAENFLRSLSGYVGSYLPQPLDEEVDDFRSITGRQITELKSILARLDLIPEDTDHSQLRIATSSEDIVSLIPRRFHTVATQLANRQRGRLPFELSDEYDVQDLLHGLLRLHFNDIRPEEGTPSHAGGGSRMDFLLKPEQIVIEVKKTREGLESRDVGDQPLIDIQRYQQHPDCKTLTCFVYDPDGLIRNPDGLESDLSKEQDGLTVTAIIPPRV